MCSATSASVVLQFNFFCNCDAIFRDYRCAELLVNHRVAAFRTERDLDSMRQEVDAPQNGLARMLSRHNLLCRLPVRLVFDYLRMSENSCACHLK